MIIETTGKFKEVCIPYRQTNYKEYDDCYGVYKFAKRVRDDYVQLSQTAEMEGQYNEKFKRTIIRHRWVYQNEVGELSPTIIIHHLNHVKGDDRPENLSAETRATHKSKHNKDVYARYGTLKKALNNN